MKNKFMKLLIMALAMQLVIGTGAVITSAAEKKTVKKTNSSNEKTVKSSKKSEDKNEDKTIYDQKMIDAVKLFSQKKSSLSKKTRTELEDVLTISAAQAREGNYKDAIFVLDEIETILSGKKKQSGTIKVEDSSTGEVKNYQFDINKENKIVSANESENDSKAEAAPAEEVSASTPPDTKFKLQRLSPEEQKLYTELINVLPVAEYRYKKHNDPESARRLMRLRRVFYNLKKKGMGYSVDEEVIKELITEQKSSKKSK